MSSRIWSNAVIYLGTTVATALLGLASAVLMTHLLSPEQYGRLGVFLSVLYIAMPVISLAAEGLIAVNKSTLDDHAYTAFRRTAIGIALISFGALQLAFIVGWAIGLIPDELLLLIPLYALLRFTSAMAMTEYVAEQQARTYGVVTILSSLVSLGMTYLLLLCITGNAFWRVVALMSAESLLLWIRYRGRLELLKPQLNQKYKTQILQFGLPSILALAGAWALNESDKALVASKFGLATAGLYTAAATLSAIMTNINQSLTNALYPRYFARLAEEIEHPNRTILSYVTKFFLINTIFSIAITFSYWAAKDTLLPEKYADASPYFYALIFSTIAISIYRPLGLAADFYKMAKTRAAATLTGGAITIAVSVIGMTKFGSAIFAPAGICAGYTAISAILLFSINRNRAHLKKPE